MTQKEKVRLIAEKVMGWKECWSGNPDIKPGEYQDVGTGILAIFGDSKNLPAYLRSFNPYANDADALMVLMHFPQWSACADETDTWVGFYCTAEEGFMEEYSFKVMARYEPDPAQRFRTCICEAALKIIEGRSE